MNDVSDIKEIMQKIDVMLDEIRKVSNKLDKVIDKLEINHEECSRMGEHINFVENIYESVKRPLNYICDTVNVYREQSVGLIEGTDDS
jgi:archaellum component FlaC